MKWWKLISKLISLPAACAGSFSKTRDIRVGVKGFLFSLSGGTIFPLLLQTWRTEEAGEGVKKNPRCSGGSTSRNKQEATRLSGPPAAAHCHVASKDKQGGRSVLPPATQTLFIHDNELLNGASGGNDNDNFEPCVHPVPPLKQRDTGEWVKVSELPLRFFSPPDAQTPDPVDKSQRFAAASLFVTSPRWSSTGVSDRPAIETVCDISGQLSAASSLLLHSCVNSYHLFFF